MPTQDRPQFPECLTALTRASDPPLLMVNRQRGHKPHPAATETGALWRSWCGEFRKIPAQSTYLAFVVEAG